MRGLAAGILVLGLATAYAAAGPSEPRVHAARGEARVSVLRISGAVGGLYPGARRRLALTLRNRGSRPLLVDRVSARPVRARRGCAARHLRVAAPRRRVRIPARRRTRLWLPVHLRGAVPDACKLARFQLRVRARVRPL